MFSFSPKPMRILLAFLVLCPVVRAFGERSEHLITGQIRAGASRVEITSLEAGPVNDPLYVKALVIEDQTKRAVVITVDAVAIEQIGSIRNTFLKTVRQRIEKEAGIRPEHVLVNASHCHGIVCNDIEDRTVKAVNEAVRNLEPVKVGAGRGQETRISENRRLRLKNGRETDVRHAYSMPSDEDVVEIGPIDPEIGVLRLDRMDGTPLAIVYNFAMHPIQGVPGGANTADVSGFASTLIETTLGHNVTALFLQGCAGDINPVRYKDVHSPRDAEPLGNLLGLSVVRAVHTIRTVPESRFQFFIEKIQLPRSDLSGVIERQQAELNRLVPMLRGTSLNLKSFLQVYSRYRLNPEFPSGYSLDYLNQRAQNNEKLKAMDIENLKNLDQYLQNIQTMEEITRVQTNLSLLRMHQTQNQAQNFADFEVEMVGMQVGAFTLITFPGELTVRIGLALKKRSPLPFTFIAGYTNGYIYYAPTEDQLKNAGWAQEDSDCILAPGWQKRFDEKAMEMLKKIQKTG